MPTRRPRTMHPSHFTVNRTWLAFRMNQHAIKADGEDFDIFVLQDAASMFIFGNAFALHGAASPAETDAAVLMERAWAQKQEWPEEIVLPGEASSDNSFVRIAKRNAIVVRSVPEAQMSFYIKDVWGAFEKVLAQRTPGDT